MKKYINLSMAYAIAALVGGVFYREFTKWNGYTGVTALGKVHVHLLVLGTIMFLITALYAEKLDIESQKTWKPFMICYNTGLITAVIMLVVRGIIQVLNLNISKALSASISGIAGIGHILLGTGLILLLVTIRKSIQE